MIAVGYALVGEGGCRSAADEVFLTIDTIAAGAIGDLEADVVEHEDEGLAGRRVLPDSEVGSTFGQLYLNLRPLSGRLRVVGTYHLETGFVSVGR